MREKCVKNTRRLRIIERRNLSAGRVNQGVYEYSNTFDSVKVKKNPWKKNVWQHKIRYLFIASTLTLLVNFKIWLLYYSIRVFSGQALNLELLLFIHIYIIYTWPTSLGRSVLCLECSLRHFYAFSTAALLSLALRPNGFSFSRCNIFNNIIH